MTTSNYSKFEHYNRFVDYSLRHLRPLEVKAWCALWRRAGKTGLVRWHHAWLCDVTGATHNRYVRDAINVLIQAGCLRDVKEGGRREKHSGKVFVDARWESGQVPNVIKKRTPHSCNGPVGPDRLVP